MALPAGVTAGQAFCDGNPEAEHQWCLEHLSLGCFSPPVGFQAPQELKLTEEQIKQFEARSVQLDAIGHGYGAMH